MAVQPGYWGIDIGQCALKAIRLQIIDNKVTATAFDYVEHPKILSQPDADPEQLTREALEKFLSRNPIKGDKVAISVAGQSGLARFVKLPPVEEKKIEDIVKFEAKQQIPFPLEEVVWDYQKVSEGAVEGGFAIDTEIGLFAMKRDMISRVLNHFTGVHIEVHDIQMSPLALCNYLTYDMLNKGGPDASTDPPPPPTIGQKRRCIVALDVGTDGSNLIITDGGKIIWQRPIPIGGNHFTRALTKELKLTFAKAEHLKRNASKSPELANILRALKPVLTDFVGEVQRSLGYFTNTHRDAQVEYLVGVGSAFKLPGLQKYLGDKLQLRVEKPTKFQRIAGESVTDAPVFVDNLLTFPVAYGLALQSLGVARLRTNLLPPEITRDRKIRAKKPWAVTAASLLLLGTTVWATGYVPAWNAVNDAKITQALDKNRKVNKEAEAVVKQVADKQVEVDKSIKSVQSIIAGKDERLNWLRINEFVNACLPVPGPDGNMKSSAQERFWNNQDGSKRATEKYYERIKNGVNPKIAYTDDDMRQFLPALDIEAVHCRFTKDLPGFFSNAKQYCQKYVGTIFDGMDENERAPMLADPPDFPKGEGWIFEIRGTTWFDQGTLRAPELLRETLLANLKAAAKASKDPAIQGRISHIFLYNCSNWRDEAPVPDKYHFIYTSLINYLIPSLTATPGDGKTDPPPFGGTGTGSTATGAQSATIWRPLRGGDVGVPAGDNAPASGVGAASAGANPYLRSTIPKPRDPVSTGAVTGGTKDDPKAIDKKSTNRKARYEFIIVFVWKENTPSDRYIESATPATPTPGQTVQPPPRTQP